MIPKNVKNDFPVLQRKIKTDDGKEKPLIYFDSACMALKPLQVVQAMDKYYLEFPGCAGRSIHTIGDEATEAYHEARAKVAKFINARHTNEIGCYDEIVWTRNTTEGINLVARTLDFPEKSKILTTNLEHHSGLLPFFELSKERGFKLEIVNTKEDGTFAIEDWEKAIDDNTKLISIVHASNVSSTVAPIEEICKIAHDHGALVLSDDAQYAPHHRIDVQKSGIDFCTFSIHKMCGPTGMGVLYTRHDLYKQMKTFLVGGDTIKKVWMKDGVVGCEYLPPPEKYEAGLQNYAGAIGAGATVDYLSNLGMENIEELEKRFAQKLAEGLLGIPQLELIGPEDYKKRSALASFTIDGMKGVQHAHEVARKLDTWAAIMLRSGYHCAMPFHEYIDKEGSVRASLYFYNTVEEIDFFLQVLKECIESKAFSFLI